MADKFIAPFLPTPLNPIKDANLKNSANPLAGVARGIASQN